MGSAPLQQPLPALHGAQDELALGLVHHPRAVELLHKALLLQQDGHRRAVGLDGLEARRGFDLPVDDELPHLLALHLSLHHA